MKTFEDFFYDLPESEKELVEILRELVLGTAPDFEERISYGVPYYFLNSRVCYIWPSSVKPGPKSGVALGFCRGNLLSNEQGLVDMEGRKEVGMIIFHSPAEIRPEVLQEILYEAILIDAQFPGKSRKKSNKRFE